MVKAVFENNRETGTMRMSMHGHAGYDELGKDPVCAGASVLAFTLAQYVSNLEEEGGLESKPTIRIATGNMRVKCRPKPACWGEAATIFNFTHLGMRLLSEAYPKHVQTKVVDPAEAVSIEDSSTSRTD